MPRIFTLWLPSEEKGIAIPYTNISLHAAQAAGTRGQNSPACIYMQLDGAAVLTSEPAANGNSHRTEGDDDDEAGGLLELRLVPANQSTCNIRSTRLLTIVNLFFQALCACAALHPDPPEEDDPFGPNHEWITADNFEDAEEDGDREDEGNVAKWRRTE